jgi:hypothetical protein
VLILLDSNRSGIKPGALQSDVATRREHRVFLERFLGDFRAG